ncbi:hypothetical protein ACHQM5_008941 [Ranunculus cassubicifolius]
MENGESAIPVVEGEENVFTAAQIFVRALETNKNLTGSMKQILKDLNVQLSSMNIKSEGKEEISTIEEKLNAVEEKITRWESDQSMIWDSMPEAGSDYLEAVDDVRKLAANLGSLSSDEDENVTRLLGRTQRLLQMAMARLEGEFGYLLYQNKQSFEPEQASFRESEDVSVDNFSNNSMDFDSLEESMRRRSSNRISEDSIIDLVHPDVLPDLKNIANVMISSNYDQECCQVYISTRKDALEECLLILQVEKLSIEEVVQMEWSSLNIMIKKWMRAMKIFTRVYLSSERRLCDDIFGDSESIGQFCFVQTSKPSMLQLLSFGEAIAIGPRKPEKLFRIIDMYETLSRLLPEIDNFFPDESGSVVKSEYEEVLKRLGECVVGTLSDFESSVQSHPSKVPLPGGGIHQMTKYVMNYITFLADYSETLNLLLQNDKDAVLVLPRKNSGGDEESECERSSCSVSPIAHRFRSLTSTLETNLKTKSCLYKDAALQHFFLMNNICYMVTKVKDSDLRSYFGDDWIRQHNWTFQQDAMKYERAAWSPILAFLKEDGLCNPGSNTVSKTILKERFKNFNIAFEEAYRNQTGWSILDLQLREDLRISVSQKIIQAYRTFLGRHSSRLDSERHLDRYIKYNADDLQNFLLDFFGGSPLSLHARRK